MKKNIYAIIPARSGSKRLPNKNIKNLGGKPLIQWTIDTAITSDVFSQIIVSTDSHEIAEISISAGAEVPWLRPAYLSTDTATSVDVVKHAILALKESGKTVDAVMLLQPTSPFRSIQSIKNAVDIFNDFKLQRSIISVSLCQDHPAWCNWRDSDGTLSRVLEHCQVKTRSQDLEPVYAYNGSIYLISTDMFLTHKNFMGVDPYGLVIDDRIESIDIDDSFDWLLAEFALTTKQVKEI